MIRNIRGRVAGALMLGGALLGVLLSSAGAQAQDVSNGMSTRLQTRRSVSDKSWKVQVSPLSLMINSVFIEMSAGDPTSAWSLGGEIERTNFDVELYRIQRNGVAFTPTYFFQGSPYRDSWYWSPRLAYRWGKIKEDLVFMSIEGSYRAFGTEQNLGYQWHWDNFNINLGLGVAVYGIQVDNVQGEIRLFGNTPYSSDDNSTTVAVVPSGELKMGWSF